MGSCLSVILPPRVLGISRRASRNGSTDPITDDEDNKEESSMIQQVNSLRNASLNEGTDLPEIKVHKIEDLTTMQLVTSGSTSSKGSAHLVDDEDHNKKGTASPKESPPLPVDQDQDHKKEGPTTKRRALLIGITYAGSKTWSELDGPHHDVDHYQELLTSTLSYTSLIAFPFNGSDSRSYLWISPGRHHHNQGSS